MTYAFGNFEINYTFREIILVGERQNVELKVYDLIISVVESVHQAISKDTLQGSI